MDERTRSAKHVTASRILRADREDGVFTLHLPGHGVSIDVEAESAELVQAILEGFRSPTTPDAFARAHPDVPEELLTYMVRSCFVVAEDELAFLEHGFLRPTTTPAGVPWAFSDLPELAVAGAWVVLGAPVDMGAQALGGARQGPSEIRKALSGPLLRGEGDVIDYEFKRSYRGARPVVADLGDVDPDGSRMDHVGQRLAKVVRELFAQQMRPIVLGGDHSITHYVLCEAIERGERFGIIHFDAHADMGPSASLSHSNVFGTAIASPHVAHILQIGLRVIERVSPFATPHACPKRTMVTAREAAQGLALRAIESLPRDMPYYLTFDIDCIDASIVRETGTPVFGGLSVELASELVDTIARRFTLLGADFVEVTGAQSGINAAATIAANLLQRCVLGECPFEPLSSDVYDFDR